MKMTGIQVAAIAVLLVTVAGCTTIPVDQRQEVRDEVNRVAAETIAELAAADPTLQRTLDESVGYVVGRLSATKLPVVGGGYGFAVLHDKEHGTRTYLDIKRFDFGAGLGTGRFRALVVFETQEAMERFRRGSWESGIGAESVAGKVGGGSVKTFGDGYSVLLVPDSGAAITATARLVRTSVNHDLTDTGVSELSFPNTGFLSADEQPADAPRIWDHKLPFLAQQVIDKGYDLPLPYGVGFTYADVDQEQLLSSMKVGINGSPIIPIDFVDFENARSQSNSFSVKADAWLFPFMNVFAMIGHVDGNAPVDVLVDGNGFLDELDINCSTLPPNPLCPLLEDQLITLPINASFEGNTYGIGTILAAGWNGWFVAIPLNWTYADMVGSETDGVNFTATPRGGYVFKLGRNGNLSTFFGGNYLDSELTVDGLATAPGTDLIFDYIIDQENKDKWNAVIGFNWDINKRLSWSAEYNGFIGSRDSYITSLVWKY